MTIATVHVPAFEQYGVGPIVVGACGANGRRFRRWAHAHNSKRDPEFGRICVLGYKRLGVYERHEDGSVTVSKPSRTLWHELAHILTPNHGHDDAWRAKMRELGQPVPRQYAKKKSGMHRHAYSRWVRRGDMEWRTCRVCKASSGRNI